MQEAVLALEASTQAAKAAVVALDGQTVAQAAIPYPDGVSDIATMDADRAYETLLAAGRSAVEQAAGVAIRAAGLCTIWQSLLPLDAGGSPMERATTWAYTLPGALAADARADKEGARSYYRRTGCIPHSQLPVFHALYHRSARPEFFRAAASWTSLQAYIFGKMTGTALHSRCAAAGSGWLNVDSLEYDDMALSIAGLAAKDLPPLCDADFALPLNRETALALGIEAVPLASGGGDGGLNQIGSGGLRDGIMTCSVGTSGAIRIASRKPILPNPPSTWCYYGTQGWYFAGAATSGACNCVDWVRQNLLGNAPFAALERAMVSADKSGAPVFLPFLWGERCPGWDDARTGGFAGLRGTHGAGDIYYAALESALMLLRLSYEAMLPFAGEPRLLTVSGGITNSVPWLQMAADIFERPIEIAPEKNASLMGAAALAMAGGGFLESIEDFPARRGRLIQPDAATRQHYRARKARFMEEYVK